MYYIIKEGKWADGTLHDYKIRIHPDSALLFLENHLYCQDPDGNILRIETKANKWLAPINLHSKETDSLARAWIGTPISGHLTWFMYGRLERKEISLCYLSASGTIVKSTDGFTQPDQEQTVLDVKDPRVSAWQDAPWVDAEHQDLPIPDFAFAPAHSHSEVQPIVFRTARDFLNLCWRSSNNAGRWVFHPEICQTAPGSHFSFREIFLHPCYTTLGLFFFSQEGKMEMIEVDPYQSEEKPCISRRTIVDENCGTKPWERLIMVPASVSESF
jgi:hypothetical protein